MSRQKIRHGMGVAVLVALAGVGVWQVRQTTTPAAVAERVPLRPLARVSAGDDFERWVAAAARLGPLPRSLEGTAVDGAAVLDGQGQLQVDEGLRYLFDYFLASAGEESPEQIQARIAGYLHRQLPAAAARQAWAVLERYLAYRDALATLPAHDGSLDGMLASLEQQRALRDQVLGPALAEAFFSAEDAYADFALRQSAILRDSGLAAAEKAQQIQALLAGLPEDQRQMIEATGAPMQMEQAVARLRQRGASEAEVWQMREQQFGSPAAERLQRLDEVRSEWAQRYAEYRRQRARIEAAALAEPDRTDALVQLRQGLFSPQEQKRVEALDRIAGQPADD